MKMKFLGAIALHGVRILLVIVLVLVTSPSRADGSGDNENRRTEDDRDGDVMESNQQRNARKIGQGYGHPSNNNNNNFPLKLHYHVYNTHNSRHNPSPTPASFANSDYVLGRNSQLNNLFKLRPAVSATPVPASVVVVPPSPTANKPVFQFGAGADPKDVWNWLLAQTPSRPSSGGAPSQQQQQWRPFVYQPTTPAPPPPPSPDNSYVSYGFSTTSRPSAYDADVRRPVVIYHNNPQFKEHQRQQLFHSERLPEYVATPVPFLAELTTPARTDPPPPQPEVFIATTAKPFIEKDLRENFRPFLKPNQLDKYDGDDDDGYPYEQSAVALSSTERTSFYEARITTERPIAVPAKPKPFRKKIHHHPAGAASKSKTASVRIDHQSGPRHRYSPPPLFRESLLGAETNRAEVVGTAANKPSPTTTNPEHHHKHHAHQQSRQFNGYRNNDDDGGDDGDDGRNNEADAARLVAAAFHSQRTRPIANKVAAGRKFSLFDETRVGNEVGASPAGSSRDEYRPDPYLLLNKYGGGRDDYGVETNSVTGQGAAAADEEGYGQQDYSGSGGGSDDGSTSLPGAGVRYPAYGSIPRTAFNCSHQLYKGPFADRETGCQVWHYCDLDGRQSSFLCPNGTVFDQRSYTCDWWYNVRCDQSAQLYALNERLFKYRVDEPPQFPFDYHGPHVDHYILQQYLKNLREMRKKLYGEEGRKARLKEKIREQKRKELIRKLNLELDDETHRKYGFLLRRR